MKGFIKVKSYKNNTFLIPVNHIGVIRESRDYAQNNQDDDPELKDIEVVIIISNMCGEPLCITAESIDDIEKKIAEAL